MGIRLSRCLVALLLVLALLSSGLAGCGTVQPVSSSASMASFSAPVVSQGSSEGVDSMDAGSASASIAEEAASTPVAEALPLPTEPFYYTAVEPVVNPGRDQTNKFLFVYSLERNVLKHVYYNMPPRVLPEGVWGCAVSAEYETTFAGYGLLAGAIGPRVDISRDGGATWEQVALPLESASWGATIVRDVGFTSATDGWVTVSGRHSNITHTARIFTTRDGGNTWQLVAEQPVGREVVAVRFVTAEHGFLATQTENGAVLLETRDGGVLWTQCPIVLPPGFANAAQEGEVEGFMRYGQGYRCIFRGLFDDDRGAEYRYYIDVALTPIEEDGATTWTFGESLEMPAGIGPYRFYRFIESNMYYPGYYGIDYSEAEEGDVSHLLMDRLTYYAHRHKLPGFSTRNDGWEQIVSAELVEGALAAVYNLYDFDVTTLASYSEEDQAFIWRCFGEHGRMHQNSLSLSIRVTHEGNIELIREVSECTSEAYMIKRGGIYIETLIERLVFKPGITVNGNRIFTVLTCENLDDYPAE